MGVAAFLLLLQAAGLARAGDDALGFEARIDAELRVERVYDGRRTWPSGNGPRLAFETRVTRAAIVSRTEAALKKSAALETFWGLPIDASALQGEVERMARETRDPAGLRELFSALDEDPTLIAECLARRALATRRFAQLCARDPRIHGTLRREAEQIMGQLATGTFRELAAGRYARWEITTDDGAAERTSSLPLDGSPTLIETDETFEIRRLSVEGGKKSVEAIVFRKTTPSDWLDGFRPSPGWREPRVDNGTFRVVVVTGSASGRFHNEPPDPRQMTAVWTGAEMIVWGGAFWHGTGGRYDPVLDEWTPTSTGSYVPQARGGHTAVWTGTEMILWGGAGEHGTCLDSGARYDPVADVWSPMDIGPNVPAPRTNHSAVWTGSEMIVWGGNGPNYGYFNDGGRYSPVTRTWRPTSVGPNVPSARYGHVALWTGTEMIVWSGANAGTDLATGARYDPVADSWLAMPMGPSARHSFAVVWTGSEMIVWGGFSAGTDAGARFDPASNLWLPCSTSGAPTGRGGVSGVWSGTEMIVWGGGSGSDGGRYDPVSDSWRPVSVVNAPLHKSAHLAVWTGTEMIVWGGPQSSGARYRPSTDTWAPMYEAGIPSPRSFQATVWTGAEMVVWGGVSGYAALDDGGRYDPITDSWQATSVGLSARSLETAVWTGTEMILWGGSAYGPGRLDTGARYNPSTDSWTPTSTGPNTPTARQFHSAVWSGSEMIVWGGDDTSGDVSTGGRYDPVADSWRPTAGAGAPTKRFLQMAAWTGTEMLIWGGKDPLYPADRGGLYDPATDKWRSMAMGGVPIGPGYFPEGAWTGTEWIVCDGNGLGARYDPTTDKWSLIAIGGPAFTDQVVWAGGQMIMWGEYSGGRYLPQLDAWLPISSVDAPTPRTHGGLVWTGSRMIVWGGQDGYGNPLNSGGFYDPLQDLWHSEQWLDPARADFIASPRTGGSPLDVAFTDLSQGRLSSFLWSFGDSATSNVRNPRHTYLAPGSYDVSLTVAGVSGQDTARKTGYVVVGSGADFSAWPRLGAPILLVAFKDLSTGSTTSHLWRFGDGATSAARNPQHAYTAVGRYDVSLDVTYASGSSTRKRGAYVLVAASAPAAVVTGAGPDPAAPPLVLAFDALGEANPGTNIMAYGGRSLGANVGTADLDGDGVDDILSGPGPGAVFGPHVRAFRTSSVPFGKVSFFAYGTLRYGVAAEGVGLDPDRFDEIVTAAGPGPPFGPHVRCFKYDNVAISPLAGASFFAYGTLRYGVNVGRANVTGGTWPQILTMPGPGPTFYPQVRAFAYGPPLSPLSKVNFWASGGGYGGRVDGGNVDADGWDEILAAVGPSPDEYAEIQTYNYDDNQIAAIPALSFEAFPGERYGPEPHAGDFDGALPEEILVSRGPDPTGDARVRAFAVVGGPSPIPSLDFVPYSTVAGSHTAVGDLGI